ncbi:FUSC family protein [Rhodospirillaceae bacterium SYSU D60014]|uniref:FUSC family protein n=1 Tax=Virgifigura deserti TaxID=2268457 RepID=UPI000E669116
MRLSAITRTVEYRRPVRLAIQTGLAGLATFAIGHALGVSELSWAVISALFVVQASIGGTLAAAAGRIIGAALGAVLGLAWMLAGGTETIFLTGLGIVLAGATTAYISGIKPTLRYGAVTSAIIILSPSSDPFAQAWHYAAAIGLGVVIGTLASVLVFPWSARRGVDEELGRAVRRCGDLLAACLGALMGRDANKLAPIHSDIRQALGDAQAAAGPSRKERLRRASNAPEPEALIRAVERLWHALLLIDRTDTGPLPEAPRRRLEPYLEAATEACCAYLADLGEAIASGDRPDPPELVHQRLEALQAALEEIRRERVTVPLPGQEAERVFTLIFAFDQLNQDIADLARLHTARLNTAP